MMHLDLSKTLANRKKFIDEVSDIAFGHGTNTSPSKHAGESRSQLNSSSFEPRSTTGYTGLQNQGATCYLNSLLQTLFMFQEFRKAVFEFSSIPSEEAEQQHPDNMDLAKQLQLLFAHLQLSKRVSVSTLGLTQKGFGWTSSDSFIQQDVQECMSVIFNYVATFCFGSSLSNFIEEKWSGEIFDRLICKNCGKPRGSSSKFHDLQIQVRGMGSVEKSLEAFCQDETLDDIECGNCGHRGPHLKGIKLQKIPYALSLQLKRFDLDWNTLQKVKVNDQMSIPLTLNMAPFIDGENVSDDSSLIYDLLAVLVHSGSAYAGHYCCYIREPTTLGDGSHGKWILFNDSSVLELTTPQFETVFGIQSDLDSTKETIFTSSSSDSPTKRPQNLINVKNNAYMLLFRKRDACNISSVSCDLIASHLKDLVDKDNEAYFKAKAEWEYERQFIHVKINYENDIRIIKINKSETLDKLTDNVWQEYFSRKHSENAIDFDRYCIRLREFDSIRGVLLGPVAKIGENPILSSLPEQIFRRVLYVEVKSPNDEFSDDTGETLPLEMVVYIPTTWDISTVTSKADSFNLPISISVDANLSVEGLRKKILQVAAVKFSDCGVQLDEYRRVNDIVICRMDIQSGQYNILLDEGNTVTSSSGTTMPVDSKIQSLLKGGDRIYVDLSKLYNTERLPNGYLNMVTYFGNIFNMMTVVYTIYKPDMLSSIDKLGVPETGPEVVVDARHTLRDLKSQIAEKILLETSSFALCRSVAGVPGKELKDLSVNIRTESAPMENVLKLAVVITPPLEPDQFRINVFCRILSSSSSVRAGKETACVEAFELARLVIRKNDLVGSIKDSATLSESIYHIMSSEFNEPDNHFMISKCTSATRRMRYCTLDQNQHTEVSIVRDMLLSSSMSVNEANISPTGITGSITSAISFASEGKTNRKVNVLPKEVLRDSSTFGSSLGTKLIDGCCFLLDIDLDILPSAFTDDHLWLRFVVWNQKDDILSKFYDIPTLKSLTFAQLKRNILELPSIKEQLSSSITCETLLLAKPFTWQLDNFQSNLPALKWASQPKDENILSGAPWNLKDNSIVLIKDSTRDPLVDPQDTMQSAYTQSVYSPEGPEVGFKLYSSKERQTRNEVEAREMSDRKALMDDKIKALMSGVSKFKPTDGQA